MPRGQRARKSSPSATIRRSRGRVMPEIPVSQDRLDAHPDTLDFRDKMYVPARITLARGGVGQAAVEFAPSASSLRDRRRTLV